MIKKPGNIETDSKFKGLVGIEVGDWRNTRNKALHEMAKLEDGDLRTWEKRIAALAPVSAQGLSKLRRVDDQVRKLGLNQKEIKRDGAVARSAREPLV